MSSTPLVLETQRLTKTFGSVVAVSALSLSVYEGEVYALLGPNGAGKTTALSLILGLIRPTRGYVRFFGSPGEMAGFIGASPTYPHLSGYAHLELAFWARGIPPDRKQIERALAMVGLADAQHRRAGTYSTGMRQRLGIARALLFPVRLLILDEPTSGLDPQGMREVRELIRFLSRERGITVILSSHLLGEVEQVATRVGILVSGQLRWEEDMEAVRNEGNLYELEVSDMERAKGLIAAWGTVVEEREKRWVVRLHPNVSPDQLNVGLLQQGIRVSHLARRANRLEAAYLEICHGITR